MNIKEKWVQALGKPSFEIPESKLTFEKEFKCDGFCVEVYTQPNGPDTVQRVFMAIPDNFKKPCPAVAVPFYYAEAMLGFNPETNEKIEKFGDIPMMKHLVERGYIVIGGEAYHLTYLKEKPENEKFEFWEMAAKKLIKDNPKWTGMGKLVSDTKLLIDAICKDERVDGKRIAIAGHSLGGKMAFYTGCLDERIKVIIANDFGIGWEQTNWKDIWYWGDLACDFKNKNMEHDELLRIANGKPFCLVAGQYDDDESLEIIKKSEVYNETDGKLEFINHKSGHIPPYEVLDKAYDFLEKWL